MIRPGPVVVGNFSLRRQNNHHGPFLLTSGPKFQRLKTCRIIDRHSVFTHYIIVRNDLPLGLMAAQITHAAGESSPGNISKGTHAVVLGVSPSDLERLAATRFQDVPHVSIVESDAPFSGQLMAIGLPPAPRWKWKRLVSDLPLLREVST